MFVELVLPQARLAHAAALMEMHHDRKRVFVDALGWQLPSAGSWLEVDEFDNEHTVYLIARSAATGKHEGSVRLLPSTARHMLSSMFSGLCAGAVPMAQDCWEISRLVAAPPAVAGTSLVRVHRILALALAEFADLNSITRYTLVTESHRVAALLSIGWHVRPLGLPTSWHGQSLQALEVVVDRRTLFELRSKFRVTTSILQTSRTDRFAA